MASPRPDATWPKVRRLVRIVLTPVAVVLAVLYFLIDGLVLSAIKPLGERLIRLPMVAGAMQWVARLGPYATLVLFLVPIVALEPLKLVAFYLMAKRQVVAGMILLGITELLKILIIERLFALSRKKLMSIPAFAWVYGFVTAWLAYLQSLPPWQVVLRWVARVKRLGRRCLSFVRGRSL